MKFFLRSPHKSLNGLFLEKDDDDRCPKKNALRKKTDSRLRGFAASWRESAVCAEKRRPVRGPADVGDEFHLKIGDVALRRRGIASPESRRAGTTART